MEEEALFCRVVRGFLVGGKGEGWVGYWWRWAGLGWIRALRFRSLGFIGRKDGRKKERCVGFVVLREG